ncbi:SDR family NAD(P)-dependent oxidoreductase [Bacillus solitudinis]|uniref:SDR family NAD(P)-dependent oxidoreductase n=1 Tax=Bacillus solitudinis TaxID=2014074 RepID=UPI000C2321EA|nr:SDR family oxidoreductase [Bacillus solitudinis]
MVAKKVWITGASSGIGRQMALDAAREGHIPILIARNEKRLRAIQIEIESLGGQAYIAKLDVSDFGKVDKVLNDLLLIVGGIDVLINNAGFAVFRYLKDAPIAEIKEMFDVNVVGLIYVTQRLLPEMMNQQSGHIINIASQAGKFPTPKASVYAATKHAVLGFTNSLRMELEDTNIRVSSVNPGPIRTAFFERADEEGSYVKNVDKWMLPPEYVSKKVIQLIKQPKRELNLPRWMNVGSTLYQLMPRVVERIAGKKLNKK